MANIGNAMGSGYGFQVAEVRSLDDYYKSGRVKVRIYGSQDDEQNVKDENLTEAIPLMDVTSASTGKVGKAPTGLVIGSRVLIGYLSYDFEKKTPYIFGTYYRGAKPTDRSPSSATGGRESTDSNSVGIDTPGAANPGRNTAGYSFHNIGLKLNPFNTDDDKYNNAKHTENNSGTPDIKTAIKMHAPNADLPTTASADPSKKLPEVLSQVDPMRAAQTLKQMFSALSMVRNLMNSASPTPRRKTITDSLSGALCILSKEFGFEYVIDVMNKALENDGLLAIDEDYRDIVKNALADLIEKSIQYGTTNIPVSKYNVINYTVSSTITLPGLIVDIAPDLYLQQYYPIESDPYPGYIHFKDETTSVFIKRKNGEPTYTTAEEEIYAVSEKELAEDLRPYFVDKNLTAINLNIYIRKQDINVENNGMDKTMGKNAGVNIMGLLPKLLGILGPVINKLQEQHLPFSVLNQGAISQSMEKFSKAMAQIKKMKSDSSQAFALPGALGGLTGILGNIAGIPGLSGLTGGLAGLSGLTGLSDITQTLGQVSNIANIASRITNPSTLTSAIPGLTVAGAVNVSSLINKIVR